MMVRYATLAAWIREEAIPFSLAAQASLDAAVDRMVAALDRNVEVLGFGEALHGGEAILTLRNRLFQRLVERHGFRAIAIESSFPRGRGVDDYVAGRVALSFDAVQETGFSHGFGRLAANRELVAWLRAVNAERPARDALRFYGFDIPALAAGIAAPSGVLHDALDLLAAMDRAGAEVLRARIDALVGDDAAWENPAAMADATRSIGLSPAANALRIATEDLITELRTRRPELIAAGDADRFAAALHMASLARQLLNFHASQALASDERYARGLGIRDAAMADTLVCIMARERGRGRVLAFAHNTHLQRGRAVLPFASWWPAGSQMQALLGSRYAVIGTALGVSEANGIGVPEGGTLEARLLDQPAAAAFIPTHRGEGLPAAEVAALPARTGSMRNPTYAPLSAQSLSGFDWLAFVGASASSRGGPPLPEEGA